MSASAAFLEAAVLTGREYIAPGFWHLTFDSPRIASRVQAAQYVAVDVPGEFAVRLPLGVWMAGGQRVSVLFREWGERTARLAALEVNAQVSLIGPLGNTFEVPEPPASVRIVAGGLGIVPFWLLCRALSERGRPVQAVIGARTAQLLVGVENLAALGAEIDVCTDDGSAGTQSDVVSRLQSLPRCDALFGCGPPGMLRALSAHAAEAGSFCQVSLEETFGCSLGTCWGCVVPVRRGCRQGTHYPRAARETRDYDFARVCRDGTVFSTADLLWREAAV